MENLVRRRFGFRMPAGGRAAQGGEAQGVAGETLMAGLAAAGHPCLPYPDRDRRQPGLAETHPALILKSLLWESSRLAEAQDQSAREQLFRAYEPPLSPHGPPLTQRWAERASQIDVMLRALGRDRGLRLRSRRAKRCDRRRLGPRRPTAPPGSSTRR